jgi:hypothetical protein
MVQTVRLQSIFIYLLVVDGLQGKFPIVGHSERQSEIDSMLNEFVPAHFSFDRIRMSKIVIEQRKTFQKGPTQSGFHQIHLRLSRLGHLLCLVVGG